MTDPILTDDEKDALLQGVESGEVEVLAGNRTQYANVAVFEVPARNHIVSNSYPRLKTMNRKLAGAVGKAASLLLNADVDVTSGTFATTTWGAFREKENEPALMFSFNARPLDGVAVVQMRSGVVRHVVEAFYGGSPDNPPRHAIDGFTPGETSVVSLFCRDLLAAIAETWQPLIALEPQASGICQSGDGADLIDSGADVIHCEFEFSLGQEQHGFDVVWPVSTLAPLLPALDGAKRERDREKDAHWYRAIQQRVSAAPVNIQSRIGHARLSLREAAALAPGDVIELSSPRKGTIFAGCRPVLEGRFGVHNGSYAIEATRWLTESTHPQAAANELQPAQGNPE